MEPKELRLGGKDMKSKLLQLDEILGGNASFRSRLPYVHCAKATSQAVKPFRCT